MQAKELLVYTPQQQATLTVGKTDGWKKMGTRQNNHGEGVVGPDEDPDRNFTGVNNIDPKSWMEPTAMQTRGTAPMTQGGRTQEVRQQGDLQGREGIEFRRNGGSIQMGHEVTGVGTKRD